MVLCKSELVLSCFLICALRFVHGEDDNDHPLPKPRLFTELGFTVGDVTYNLWPFFIIAALLYALRLGLLFGGSIDGGGGGGYNAPGGGFDPFGDIFGGIGDFAGGIGGTSSGYNTPQAGYNTPQTGYGTPQTVQPSYGAPQTGYGAGTVVQQPQAGQTLVTQPLLSGTGNGIYTTFARVDANGNYQLDNNNYQLTAAPLNSPAVTYSTNQLNYQQQQLQPLQLTNNQLFQQRTDTSAAAPAAAITGSTGLYTFGQVLPNGQYNAGQQTKSLIGAAATDNSSNNNDNQYIFYTPNRRR